MSDIDIKSSHAVANTGGDAMRPALCDPAKYRAEVDLFDITEAQKQELLLTLWSIMRSFVEVGFTVDVCAAVFDDLNVISDDGELE